jgi:hypothetical protein
MTYLSLFFKLSSNERIHPGRQDWPSVSKWARGSKFVDAQLGAISAAIDGKQKLFVSVFKAAPHWILRNDWMAEWVLRRSFALLQDETGLRPSLLNASRVTPHNWVVHTQGKFRDWENRERTWYPADKAEMKALFVGPELPLTFGYAQHGGAGVLLTAWRRDNHLEHTTRLHETAFQRLPNSKAHTGEISSTGGQSDVV